VKRLLRPALLGLGLVALGMAPLAGCDADAPPPGKPDARLSVHAVESSTPTPAGLAYVEAVASVQTEAEAADGLVRVRVLQRGLSLPVPAGLPEAEILRLDLAATLGETMLQQPEGAAAVVDLLRPMVAVDRSLPLDRASARALVTLGDAAVRLEDDALAAGSYARAIEMMSLLRQELLQR
jgi:hypothetical protein